MKRKVIGIGLLLALAATAFVIWEAEGTRRIDGRTAHGWLLLAEHARQSVPYQAEGRTVAQGTTARFELQQGKQGRYAMQVTDAKGKHCTLGFDGAQVWYATGARTVSAPGNDTAHLPESADVHLLGTDTIAARPAVRLSLRSGDVRKELALDRKTGVVLAMASYDGKREISRMQLDNIIYRAVEVPSRPADAADVRPATLRQMRERIGHAPLQPTWLPEAFTARGMYVDSCSCCQTAMAVLHYSDSLRAVTLFEFVGDHACAMSEGCRMAPRSGELVESRRVGKFTVIAVGNIDRRTLDRLLDSLE